MSLSVQGIHDPDREDWNVIAESKGGDPNHVLVVDAHLDAVYGAGMLDNASGSATILDIAQKMKNVEPRNKLRFIWFGGEELGLLGSLFYVNNLSADELGRIRYDLDADVTATPNYDIGVLDPAAVDFCGRTVSTQFPPEVWVPPSLRARVRRVARIRGDGRQAVAASLADRLATEWVPVAAYGTPQASQFIDPRIGCRVFTPFANGLDLAAACINASSR